jgi:hypothetical protein
VNHCHDCNSDYSTPGTCNCFAPGGKRYAGTQGGPFAPVPIYVPPIQPTTYPWGTTIWCNDGNACVSFTPTIRTNYSGETETSAAEMAPIIAREIKKAEASQARRPTNFAGM